MIAEAILCHLTSPRDHSEVKFGESNELSELFDKSSNEVCFQIDILGSKCRGEFPENCPSRIPS